MWILFIKRCLHINTRYDDSYLPRYIISSFTMGQIISAPLFPSHYSATLLFFHCLFFVSFFIPFDGLKYYVSRDRLKSSMLLVSYTCTQSARVQNNLKRCVWCVCVFFSPSYTHCNMAKSTNEPPCVNVFRVCIIFGKRMRNTCLLHCFVYA